MSNIIHFKHGGLTAAKYAGAIKRLSSAGEGFPKGRSYHVWHGGPVTSKLLMVGTAWKDFRPSIKL